MSSLSPPGAGSQESPPLPSSPPHQSHLADVRESPLDVLLRMGFQRQRAEKALAATGGRGAQLAADWLLAHARDRRLDCGRGRHYLLYLCPGGRLLRHIERFRRRVRQLGATNAALAQLPHVTLATPFEVPDHLSAQVCACIEHVFTRGDMPVCHPAATWQLEPYCSDNYVGLFVGQQHHQQVMARVHSLKSQLANFGVALEPATDALHVTLAFQFETRYADQLRALCHQLLSTTAAGSWQLRVYSRDPRHNDDQVLRVLYSHVPRARGELQLVAGDYVYVPRGEHVADWLSACSWLTGQTGTVPASHLQLARDSDVWTVHRCIWICGDESSWHDAQSDSGDESDDEVCGHARASTQPPHRDSEQLLRRSLSSLDYSSAPALCPSDTPSLHHGDALSPRRHEAAAPCWTPVLAMPYEPQSDATCNDTCNDTCASGRRVWVVRHGERVDFTYGNWVPYCFSESGHYDSKDLNMPCSLLERSQGPGAFSKDSPITQVGRLQARLTGEAMRRASVRIDLVLCSPSLRCVETAYCLLTGLFGSGQGAVWPRLCVEPGLFEWLAWYRDSVPSFLEPAVLRHRWRLPVATDYQPLIDVTRLATMTDESCEQYYERSHHVTEHALSCTDGNVLLLGHAASLDTCTRQLTGHAPRSAPQLTTFLSRIPYCGVVCARADQRCDLTGDETTRAARWRLCNTGILSLTHSHNQRFDVSLIGQVSV